MTRSKKYWLYGEVESRKRSTVSGTATAKVSNQSIDNLRGWFPRRCVVLYNENRETLFNEKDQSEEDNKKNK